MASHAGGPLAGVTVGFYSAAFTRVDLDKLLYMDVSENSGTPKSSILIGFSIINHPFWGTPIFGNTHIIPKPELRAFLGDSLSLHHQLGVFPTGGKGCYNLPRLILLSVFFLLLLDTRIPFN